MILALRNLFFYTGHLTIRANIRNSTAEFLIFTGQSGENGIEVRVAEESVWLTQKLMGTLFEISVPTINEHLTKLFNQMRYTKRQLSGIS